MGWVADSGARSGGPTATLRSNRRGRSRAGSRISALLVAARTMTASVGPNPSISVKVWSSVCSRSSLLPVTPATCSGRALRIETVINKPVDIGVLARLEHLPELVAKARGVNDRLLMIERAGQVCAIGSALFERIHQPYVREGQRTGALRFGDQRAMALAGSLCLVVPAVTAFTNKNLSRAGGRASRPGLQLFPDEL